MNGFLAFPCSSQKIPSAGASWLFINMWVSHSSSTLSLSVDPASFLDCHSIFVEFTWVLGPGHALPTCFDSPEQLSFYLVRPPNKSGEEKKLPMYNLSLYPSSFIVRSAAVACVSVRSCSLCCHSFLKYTSHCIQRKCIVCIFLCWNVCVSLAYCLETTLPLKRIMTSSTARCLEGL